MESLCLVGAAGVLSTFPAHSFSHPSLAVLREHGFHEVPYPHWKDRCFKERAALGKGYP